MESLLTYLLQVNLLIIIIFLGYQFLLKGLTFYMLNRIYFLVATIYAFIYPFLDIKAWFAKQVELPMGEVFSYIPFVFEEKESYFSLSDLMLMIASVGAIVLFTKLLIQLFSLLRIHLHSEPSAWREYLFRNVIFPIAPFSFFNKIYVHKEQHLEKELHDIFKHEHVHVEGHHTWDVLLFEIVLVSCWYNPFVWLMRKAVRQNLEYLTDQQVLDKGVDRQTYQYSLLHVTKQGASVGISNQFNFKTLKKRIMMMNKKRSSKLELSKYAFLLPVFILAGATFTLNKAEAKIETVVIKAAETNVSEIGHKLSENIIQQDTTKKKASSQQTEEVVVTGFRSDDANVKELSGLTFNAEQSDTLKGKINEVKVVRGFKARSFNQLIDQGANKDKIIVIDGKVMPKDFDLSLIDDRRVDNVVILTGKDALAIDPKAKDGVISIKTRKEGDPVSRVWTIQDNSMSPTKNNLRVTGRGVSVLGLSHEGKNMSYEIDGKKVSEETFKAIKHEDIHSIDLRVESGKTEDGKEKKTNLMKVFTKAYAKEHNLPMQDSLRGRFNGVGIKVNPSGENRKLSFRSNAEKGKIVWLVNEKVVEGDEASNLNPNDIFSIDVQKSKATTAAYGDDVEGVIKIITKDSPLAVNRPKMDGQITISTSAKDIPNNAIYFIDDKEATKAEVDNLKSEKIKTVKVIKGDKAVKDYGDKAKNGVIEITTRKAKD
ncbi:M56 family metallopeptidase [Sphingobacterium sp.]|uniref:M56 family metallopeptidase n=1 Tax=Sphingobacterium sp. TaxID=341027 RepID=UPI0028980229|nr:M56 family metallopeptidase [Sphingobacterium sp.]